jgi:transposase-like protein
MVGQRYYCQKYKKQFDNLNNSSVEINKVVTNLNKTIVNVK